jgi:hypothetical protein
MGFVGLAPAEYSSGVDRPGFDGGWVVPQIELI